MSFKNLATAVIVCGLVCVAATSMATNGDELIGVGPVSRSMGGVGIAKPQDSITAIFANPAALGACPCGEKSESVFGATIFDPTVNGRINMMTPMGPMQLSGKSQGAPFVIPAVGVTMAQDEKLRLGVGAYGVSGMGVDYRDMKWDLDGDPSNGYEGDIYTKLEIMKFAGMASYQLLDDLAVGVALQATYNNLDFEQGSSHDYGVGGQVGLLWTIDNVSIGATYRTEQRATFENVFNFDAAFGDDMQDDLTLAAPALYGVGVAVDASKELTIEVDAKYIDWASAEGYDDFDWDSQWVLAIGAQFKPTAELTLRCGYNYAESPVNEHNGWDPMGVTMVQGQRVPTFGYELLRTVGFPAVVESHASLGIGYSPSEDFTVNLGYMHAFENTVSETSAGGFITLESDLSEDSYSLSMAWAF